MSKKSFQIVMEESAQRKIKAKAGLLGMNIGDYIEKISSFFEFRIRRAYEVAEVDRGRHDFDEAFTRVLLMADEAGLSESELNQALREAVEGMNDTEWTPEVKLP